MFIDHQARRVNMEHRRLAEVFTSVKELVILFLKFNFIRDVSIVVKRHIYIYMSSIHCF